MKEISTKPYLIRAIYEWCSDCGHTPYLTVKVDAQTRVPQLPPGRYEYAVEGWFGEQQMEPWSSELAVADTSLSNAPARRIVYSSRPTDDGYRFVYSALWRGDGRLARAEWKNRGRMPGSCVVKVDGERVGGELGDGTRITIG